MASRNYKRDANGRFASSGTAVSTTVGRAGGFSNQAFRSRVQTQRQAAAAQRSKKGTKSALRVAARHAAQSPALRGALVRQGVKVTVPAVAVAVLAGSRMGRAGKMLGTKRGRMDLQKAQNQRNLAALLRQEAQSVTRNGRRAITTSPYGGGSKSRRPTYRTAKSTIRPASARLRLATARSALSGRI